jgi:hypothetical protein
MIITLGRITRGGDIHGHGQKIEAEMIGIRMLKFKKRIEELTKTNKYPRYGRQKNAHLLTLPSGKDSMPGCEGTRPLPLSSFMKICLSFQAKVMLFSRQIRWGNKAWVISPRSECHGSLLGWQTLCYSLKTPASSILLLLFSFHSQSPFVHLIPSRV